MGYDDEDDMVESCLRASENDDSSDAEWSEAFRRRDIRSIELLKANISSDTVKVQELKEKLKLMDIERKKLVLHLKMAEDDLKMNIVNEDYLRSHGVLKRLGFE